MPRLTTRRLMASVALFSLAFGLPLGTLRTMLAREQRTTWHSVEYSTIETEQMAMVRMRVSDPSRSELLARRAAFHRAMRDKWWAASRRPWLPVEPDPPEPK